MNQTIDDMMGMDPESYRSTGMIFIILGFMGLIFPIFMSAFVVFMIGFLLIIGGVVFAFTGERSGWLKWLMAAVFFILGMMVILNPYPSILAIGLIMGIFFLISGFTSLVMGAIDTSGGGWVMVFNGVISLILAALVLAGWPEESPWMVGLFLGISLFFQGFAMMAVGNEMERQQGGAALQ